MNGLRYVVTGGCGFIGAAVVRLLVERGDHVLNIDGRRKAQVVPALAPIAGRENHVRLESGIRDGSTLRALFHEFRPDRVIHLASPANIDPDAHFEQEIANAFALLSACRDYASRMPAEAAADFRIVQAVRVPRPAAPNGAPASPRESAQRAAEALILNWCRARGLPLVTCMADSVFGPWQAEETLIPALVDCCLRQQTYELAPDAQDLKDFLPLSDYAQGIVMAADRGTPFACYEFSVGCERRDIDIADAVCSLLDKRLPRPGGGSWAQFVGRPPSSPAIAFNPMLDASQAEHELGWMPAGFYDGLVRAITWALSRHVPPQQQDEPLPLAAE